MAVPVSLLIVADCAFAVAAARDHGCCSCLAERAAQVVGIVAFITQQVAHGPRALEQRGGGRHIADVAGCQRQRVGTADDIGECVDFGCPAASRTADRLARTPPFAPNAERCALM